MSNKNTFNYSQAMGISMVETLVAMVIGILLLAGITQVYTSNHTATRMINGYSYQQENARAALNNLTQSLRLAGHYGGVQGNEISTVGSVSISNVGSCNNAWITNAVRPLQGFEGANAVGSVANLPAGCIPTDHYVANSDIMVVRYGSPAAMTPYASMSASKVYLRSSIILGITGGEILLGNDRTSSLVGDNSDGVGTYNYEYKTELYYVRPCSILNGSACTDGIPTLVRLGIDGTSFTAETIAEGVEQFQIEYGVDSDSDYVADGYVSAGSVSDWDAVVSARFSIVIRSLQNDNTYTDANTYSLVGGFNYTPATADNNFHRKAFTRLVQLRNMSRG